MPPSLKSASLLIKETMAKCLFLISGALRVAEFRFAEDPAQFLFRNAKQERGTFLRNVSRYLVVHVCSPYAEASLMASCRLPELIAFVDVLLFS
jgi:hypothetical protein